MDQKQRMEATKAIESVMEEVGKAIDLLKKEVGTEDEPEERTVDLFDLTEMVSMELHMKPECVYAVISIAFDMIKDLGLTVVIDEEDGEEE